VATVNKDFRVKHGIIVADGGTFGSTVTVATPTQNTHAAISQSGVLPVTCKYTAPLPLFSQSPVILKLYI
jgi:hypothetical protein